MKNEQKSQEGSNVLKNLRNGFKNSVKLAQNQMKWKYNVMEIQN